ncbi:MAG: hypothetical protein IT204_03115 [Fimbriimonadaceae bacterium]|nr:hypothetical protein [Fimbriimonadaceae bacterium]
MSHLLLGALLLAASPAAPSATVGYLDLAAALTRLAGPGAQQLDDRAAALRRLAASLAAPDVPPPPNAEAWRQDLTPLASSAEPGDAGLELQLLRQGLDAQIRRARERERAFQAAALSGELEAARLAARETRLLWQQLLALQQRYERLRLELAERAGAPGSREVDGALFRRRLLDSATDALTAWRAEQDGAQLSRARRARAVALESTLESAAAELERLGERLLARREAALATAAADRQETLATAQAALHGAIDLRLAGWQSRLPQRVEEVAARLEQQRQAWLEGAAALSAAATRLRVGDPLARRDEALAWLRVASRRLRLDLRLEPQAGLPDLTAPVLELVLELMADPALLAPFQEVELP